MSLHTRNRALVRPGYPAAPGVVSVVDPVAAATQALKSGQMGEYNQKVLYSRLLIDPTAGGFPLTRVQFELFTHNRAANPELTNLVEPQRMGPNEAFSVEGIAIQPNFGCTEAGLVKLLQDARLRIGIGPDDVERFLAPAVFIPASSGPLQSLVSQDGKGFYRLQHGQEITLQSGHPFSVRLIEGPNAGSLADADVVDIFVKLFGTFQQGIIR